MNKYQKEDLEKCKSCKNFVSCWKMIIHDHHVYEYEKREDSFCKGYIFDVEKFLYK